MSEELLPSDRREVSDVGCFSGGYPLEHINEIGVRIDPVSSARDDEGLNLPDKLCANLRPTKQPLLTRHRNRSQRHVRAGAPHRDKRVAPL